MEQRVCEVKLPSQYAAVYVRAHLVAFEAHLLIACRTTEHGDGPACMHAHTHTLTSAAKTRVVYSRWYKPAMAWVALRTRCVANTKADVDT